MNTIRLDVPSSPKAFELKGELEQAGLIWPGDYTWKYHPAHHDWEMSAHRFPWVEFTFADESLATYYRLKWS